MSGKLDFDSYLDSGCIDIIQPDVTHCGGYIRAKKIIKHVPSAEMVRYAKNGSDATTAAIRLARNITNHTNIMFSGYHGWHDWYIGSTSMNNGVPKEISNQSFMFEFNNFNSLRSYIN